MRKAVKDGPRLDLPMPFTPREFELLKQHRTEVRREPVDDLQKAVRQQQRVILLGDPGSGKTTTLWRLTYSYAKMAIKNVQAPLPVFVRLSEYTADEPFRDFLRRQLGPLAAYLGPYRASNRLIWLLDGLNEMPQAEYAERIRRIQDFLDRQDNETVVVTCRPLDYVVKLKGLQRVEVLPLNAVQIHKFLCTYLGNIAGERLFWRITGGDELNHYRLQAGRFDCD